VLVGACAAALALAGSPASAPTAVTTVACAQAGSFFNVQITGKVGGTSVGTFYEEAFRPVPQNETVVALWSYGSQSTRGVVLYGWLASGRTSAFTRCRPRAARPPAARGLRAPIKVRNGWAYTKRYDCRQRGPIVVRTDVRGATSRLTVWMERGRELVAAAEIRDGSGWLRASKRCFERDR
jgi:hypothetical protein